MDCVIAGYPEKEVGTRPMKRRNFHLASLAAVSFTTGLLVGMTVIQVYFHRFSDPLPPEKAPPPPITALKMMSHSIQATPGKAWRELVLMTLLFLWALFMLATRGFGLFNGHLMIH